MAFCPAATAPCRAVVGVSWRPLAPPILGWSCRLPENALQTAKSFWAGCHWPVGLWQSWSIQEPWWCFNVSNHSLIPSFKTVPILHVLSIIAAFPALAKWQLQLSGMGDASADRLSGVEDCMSLCWEWSRKSGGCKILCCVFNSWQLPLPPCIYSSLGREAASVKNTKPRLICTSVELILHAELSEISPVLL